MKYILTALLMMIAAWEASSQPAVNEILSRIDKNMSSENRVFEATMTIHGRRSSRSVTSKSYTIGDKKSYTEYLSPARDKGTKMLKLENQLWIYSPSTDRIIEISGHMLRQSVMGSDLSYEDMMEDRKLQDVYDGKVTGTETIDGRKTWVLDLTAKVPDVAYARRKLWIDTERFVPLKEEMYAKSGQLLKRTTLSKVTRINNRWFPTQANYKDVLKQGDGTDFTITNIKFDQPIPAYLFSKASLKK